ncbi:MAG: hypothetical protein MJ198_03425 [Bacteroidales bacterium]|nr:hypothetical protein [Bacteroidales bacterium]
MKKIIVIIAILASSFVASAQFSRFMFFSAGFSFLTDVTVTDSHLADVVDGKGIPCQESFQSVQWNFVSGMLGARMMLLPMTDNSSITVSAMPSVNIGAIYPVHDLGVRYGMNVTVPVFAELNIGAASRYIASNDWGIVLGFGYEYFYSPLLSYAVTDDTYKNADFVNSWILPTAKLGFRYWTKKNRVNEIILKAGIGEKQDNFFTFDFKLSKQYRPIHFGLIFSRILNY